MFSWLIVTLLLLCVAAPAPAHAQCNSTIAGCPAAVAPQQSDVLLGYQAGQNPHTRAFTLQQLTANPMLQAYLTASLPAVSTPGQLAFASDCANGAQAGGGVTGCLAVINAAGTWTLLPYPSPQTITIGGQVLRLGGSTANQGIGGNLMTATGTFTPGNALTVNANGTAIDSGVPPSGGAGGTTTNAPQFSNPYYTTVGSSNVLGGMTIVANSLVCRGGSGAPFECVTLPSALTIPTATLSNAALTANSTYVNLAGTGKLTLAASAAGAAGITCTQGAAPTTPGNGDIWCTTAGIFARINGATKGPYVGLTDLTATTPLTYNNATGAFACATCVTTGSGGALTVTAPLVLTNSALSLGTSFIHQVGIGWNATTNVTNDTYYFTPAVPYTTGGVLQKVTYFTGGTATPSFTFGLFVNGTAVTGCNNISVSAANTPPGTSATCTAANTLTANQTLSLVISGVSGTPFSAAIFLNYTAGPV